MQIDDTNTNSDEIFGVLYELYFFADKIGSDDFHNDAIDAIRESSAKFKKIPCRDIVF
jgi:hypothetical protein